MSEFMLNENNLKSNLSNLSFAKSELYITKAELAVQIVKLRAESSDSAVCAMKNKLAQKSKRISNEIENINSIINTGNAICTKANAAENAAKYEISGMADVLLNIWPFNGNNVDGLNINAVVGSALSLSVLTLLGGVGGLIIGIATGVSEAIFKNLQSNGYEIESIVFDDEGGYGGDQGSAENGFNQDVINMVHKHYDESLSDSECAEFTKALNNSGCGYTAMANTLFVEYEGREAEFKKTFGFDMYKDGDLNYTEMIIALYATAAKNGISKKSGSDYPGGTNDNSREEIMEAYLKDKNVNFRCEQNVTVTKDNVKSIIENGGNIIIGYRDTELKLTNAETGKVSRYSDNGNSIGHAMTVTGVTDDGKLIVSSWGEKYYINFEDLNSTTNGNNSADTFEVFYYN